MRTPSICLALAIVLLCPFASAQWTRIGLEGKKVTDIATGKGVLLTIADGIVYRLTNVGASWDTVYSTRASHVALSHSTGTVFVAPYMEYLASDSIYRSTDNGTNWTRCATESGPNPTTRGFTAIEVGPSGTVFCGKVFRALGWWSRLTKSTDDGLSWSYACPAAAISCHGEAIVAVGGGFSGGGFMFSYFSISTDCGDTWITNEVSQGSGASVILWSNAGIFFTFAPYAGLYLSTDTCKTAKVISTIAATSLLPLPTSGILAATDSEGIFSFSDNGDSLGMLNDGLTDLHIHSLVIDTAGYVYAGTDAGIWRRPASQMTAVHESSPTIPQAFSLCQNYPNPFNPNTTIRYQVPSVSNVTLKVFDFLGRELASLVNERKNPGTYEVQFDGSKLSSGVYFYRLTAGDFVQSKKLVLVK